MYLQGKLWLAAYIFAILLPLGLMFSRGFAEVCVVAIDVLWLARSATSRQWGWLREPIIRIGLLAWVWLLFVSVFAVNLKGSFAVAIPWIRYIILYSALTRWVFVDRKPIFLASKIMAIMLGFVIIDTIWQYISGVSLTGNVRDSYGRLSGPINNIKVGIFIAKMLFPIIGIGIFFALQKKEKWSFMWPILLLFAAISTIMLTGERTAFASTVIGLLLSALLLAFFEPGLGKKITVMSVILLAIAAFLLVTQSWVQSRAYDFYQTIVNYNQTPYSKLAVAGYLVGVDNYLVGAGLKGFRELCPLLAYNGASDYCNLHPHNPYVEWFAETGIIGGFLFILIVCIFLHKCLKHLIARTGNRRLTVAFALACIIMNFFPFMPTQSIFSNWPAILLWYSVSISIASLNLLTETNVTLIMDKDCHNLQPVFHASIANGKEN